MAAFLLVKRSGKGIILALIAALVLVAIGTPGTALAGATATDFSPNTQALTSLSGSGSVATIDVRGTGVDLTATGVQINVQHSDTFQITSVSCGPLFAAPNFPLGPNPTAGGTLIGCASFSPVTAADGVLVSFELTRVGIGDETITFGLDGVGPVLAGDGTRYSGGTATPDPGTLNTLTVTGYDFPAAPGNVTVTTGSASGELDVTWDAVTAGPVVTSYIVTARAAGTTATTTQMTVTGTSATLTGIPDGASQDVVVQAVNAVGVGPAGMSAAPAAPASTVPGAPAGLASTPGNGTLAVSWTPGSVGVTPSGGVTLTYSVVVEDPGGSQAAATTTTLTNATFAGLTNAVQYTVKVSASNGVVSGSSAETTLSDLSTTPFTVPDKPTGVAATGRNKEALVSWTTPASNGRPITSYVLTATPTNPAVGVTTKTLTVTSGGALDVAAGTAVSGIIDGLTNNEEYTITVTAVNAAGAGAASDPSNAVTPVGTPDSPKNPADPAAGLVAEAGDGNATITFTHVTKAEGGTQDLQADRPVTAYIVNVFVKTDTTLTLDRQVALAVPQSELPAGVTSPTTVTVDGTDLTVAGEVSISSGVATALVTGLTNGTTYVFTVQAQNQDGTSAESLASNDVTPASTALVTATLNTVGGTISSGNTRQLRVTALTASGDLAPGVTVEWAVTGVGTVSSDGLFTAGAGPGTATVTATVTQAGTDIVRVLTAEFTVRAPAPEATPAAPPENPPGPVPEAPAPSVPGASIEIITPAEGGSVSSPTGKMTVAVPPGAVRDAFVALQAAPVAAADVPAVPEGVGFQFSGEVIDLSFRDTDGNLLEGFTADKPVKLTIQYSDEDAAAAGGAQNLRVMRYDKVSGTWSALTPTVDLAARTLTVSIRHFSLFAVGVPAAAVAPTPTPSPTPTPTPIPAPTATPTPTPVVLLPATGDIAPPTTALIAALVAGLVMAAMGAAYLRRRRRVEAGS